MLDIHRVPVSKEVTLLLVCQYDRKDWEPDTQERLLISVSYFVVTMLGISLFVITNVIACSDKVRSRP